MRNPTQDKKSTLGRLLPHSRWLRGQAECSQPPGAVCSLAGAQHYEMTPRSGQGARRRGSLTFEGTVVLLSIVLMTGGFCAATTFPFCFCP